VSVALCCHRWFHAITSIVRFRSYWANHQQTAALVREKLNTKPSEGIKYLESLNNVTADNIAELLLEKRGSLSKVRVGDVLAGPNEVRLNMLWRCFSFI
jgi:Sec7-like guanine-nucleotide exchange factor